MTKSPQQIREETWAKAIAIASSVDLYHHPTTNPEHDRLKSAQELRAEIVRALELSGATVR